MSTRLKLSQDPLVYSYDSPGVMLPFLGHGDRGAERGVKLALIGELLMPSHLLRGTLTSQLPFLSYPCLTPTDLLMIH